MTPGQFEAACQSLKGYFGVIGVFGGNPATSKYFEECCDILCKYFPYEQRGLWCNNPLGKGKVMRRVFNPAISNLNVHLDRAAYDEFKRDWPESMPCGLQEDSRHSPPWVAMKDVIDDESKRWELISGCDINRLWSAMIGVFRGQLRAWFCEIAGAQAILHEDEPDYPDTGLPITSGESLLRYAKDRESGAGMWWQLPMECFKDQVRKHCHECGVPLRGYGALAQGSESQVEQVSQTHAEVYKPKKKGRRVELVTVEEQLGQRLGIMTHYLQNSRK